MDAVTIMLLAWFAVAIPVVLLVVHQRRMAGRIAALEGDLAFEVTCRRELAEQHANRAHDLDALASLSGYVRPTKPLAVRWERRL